MDTLIGSQKYCMYHGQQYIMRNSYRDCDMGQYVVNIRLPETLTAADFPEALRNGGEGEDRWVVLPERLVSREWEINVYGEWRGVEFYLTVLGGSRNPVLFGSTDDKRAESLGIPGDQYQAWAGILPADEVVITRQVERELPMG